MKITLNDLAIQDDNIDIDKYIELVNQKTFTRGLRNIYLKKLGYV